MKIGVNNLKTQHFPRILAVVLLFFLAGWILIYWLVTEKAERAMVERVKAQELTLARAGALTIDQLFRERKTNLLFLAELEAVQAGREKEGRETMRKLVDYLEGEILASVVRVDKEGRFQWTDNPQHERVREGVDIADRDYFLWAKEQKEPGEIFISQPMIARDGAREGEWIVVMTTPVFYQGKFNGLVFISFPLEDLTEKYVAPLVTALGIQSLVVTQEGAVVASTMSEAIGENVLAYPQQGEWEGKEEYLAMAREALEGKEGTLIHNYYLFTPHQKLIKAVTAYTPIEIDNQLWSLWITAPYQEAMRFALPVRIIQNQGLVFGLVGLVVLVLTFVFGVRVAQRDAFLDGFKNGRDGIKKRGKKS